MTAPPSTERTQYNHYKFGYYGQLGEGGNAVIKFIQTAITRDELDDITLIENIPGSEKWEVRDLFQRDVDDSRVLNSIVPYFQDPTKVKYFNPLTLILLPLDDTRENVDRDIPYVEPRPETEGEGHDYDVFERPGYYEF